MKLVNATPSPFGRKVAIAMKEKSIPFETLFDVPWSDATCVPRYSPLEQLPILVTDQGENVYDSMYILEWLERRYPSPALLPADVDGLLAAKRLQLLAERIMEIMVLVIFEAQRPDPSPAWAARQNRKLKGGIAEVARLVGDRALPVEASINYGDIAAAVMLTMFDFLASQGMQIEAARSRPVARTLSELSQLRWIDGGSILVSRYAARDVRTRSVNGSALRKGNQWLNKPDADFLYSNKYILAKGIVSC